MIAVAVMKIVLLLILAGFVIATINGLVRKNKDWTEILFYLIIAIAIVWVYIWNFNSSWATLYLLQGLLQ